MYDFSFSGTQVLLGAGLLLFALTVLLLVLRKRYHTNKIQQGAGSRTKYAAADVFKLQPVLFKVSITSVLLLLLLVFNWTQTEQTLLGYDYDGEISVDIDNAPPITFQKPPPPPPPPPREVIDIVDNDLIEESKTFNSMDTDVKTAIAPVNIERKPPPPPPLPPPIEVEETSTVFKIVEEMPIFGDCITEANKELRKKCSDKALMTYTSKHVTYPVLARETGVEGMAVVSFVVEKDGSMSNLKLLRDPGAGLGHEALKVVQKMANEAGAWQPGKQRGRKVRVQFNMPIKFRLQ